MLAKRIIPCLDVNAGRVVKGVNFVSYRCEMREILLKSPDAMISKAPMKSLFSISPLRAMIVISFCP